MALAPPGFLRPVETRICLPFDYYRLRLVDLLANRDPPVPALLHPAGRCRRRVRELAPSTVIRLDRNGASSPSRCLARAEIEPAPSDVRRLFDEMPDFAEIVEPSAESLELRDAYLEAGIVGPNSADGAFHVALATVSGCNVIVS